MNRNVLSACAAAALLGACKHSPEPLVVGPTSVRPPYAVAALENHTQGSLYQQSTFTGIYQDAPLAHKIGDKVKIEIAENSSGSNKSSTKLARSNSVATKG